MKALGIYRKELGPRYSALTRRFVGFGHDFKVEVRTGARKAPIVITLESHRKDILATVVQVGLILVGLKTAMKPAKTSALV